MSTSTRRCPALIRAALAATLACAVLTPGVTNAAPLFDHYTLLVSDPNDAGEITPGRDILKLYTGDDATYRYFRLDLEAAPDAAAPNGYAQSYRIYIDIDNNPATGGNGVGRSNVPDVLNGIDLILSSFFDPVTNAWTGSTDQRWNSTLNTFLTADLGAPSHRETGASLEWRVPLLSLPALGGTVWGATLDTDPKHLYDITNAARLSEPGTAALLGVTAALLLFGPRPRHGDS